MHEMKSKGFTFEEEPYLCYHLFSIKIGDSRVEQMTALLKERKLHISIRGEYLRISLNVFNDASDLEVLADSLIQMTAQKV